MCTLITYRVYKYTHPHVYVYTISSVCCTRSGGLSAIIRMCLRTNNGVTTGGELTEEESSIAKKCGGKNRRYLFLIQSHVTCFTGNFIGGGGDVVVVFVSVRHISFLRAKSFIRYTIRRIVYLINDFVLNTYNTPVGGNEKGKTPTTEHGEPRSRCHVHGSRCILYSKHNSADILLLA